MQCIEILLFSAVEGESKNLFSRVGQWKKSRLSKPRRKTLNQESNQDGGLRFKSELPGIP
jgi:hypothetical protein